MTQQRDVFFVYGLIGSTFFGIFTLQLLFLFLLIHHFYALASSKREWLPKKWVVDRWPGVAMFVWMAICDFVALGSGIGGKLGSHWGFAGFWMITRCQTLNLNFHLLHRIMLVSSLPGLIYSIYWLSRPDEIAWAMEKSFSFYPRASGFLSNPITHAEAIAVLWGWSLARLTTSLKPLERRLILGHMLLCALIIVASRVRAGILGLGCLIMIQAILLPRFRKHAVAAIGLLVPLVVVAIWWFGFNMASLHERFDLAARGWDLFVNHPWFGIGPGRFDLFPAPGSLPPEHPHNTPNALLTEMGFIGLGFFVLLNVMIFRRFVVVWSSPKVDFWVKNGLGLSLITFWLFGVFDYNFADTELVIFHSLHWCLVWNFSSWILKDTEQTEP